MAKVKTHELTGVALDYAVSVCEKIRLNHHYSPNNGKYLVYKGEIYSPSTGWAQGGPIIEREKIDIYWDDTHKEWTANGWHYGDKALVAAMRCYVASKLGNVVEIPEELVSN